MRRLNKSFLIGILVLSAVLQACSTEKTSGGVPGAIDGIALEVVTSFGESDGYRDTYEGLIDRFQQSTGAVINDDSHVSDEAWKQTVINSFDVGNEPDVVFFFSGSIAEDFVSGGKVVGIDTIRGYRPSYGMNINLGVMNTMKAGDGRNYCLPVTGFWEGLFINADLFEEYNVKIPDNMDELFEAIEAFREVSITPIAADIRNIPHYWFEYLLFNYTGPSQHVFSVPDDSGKSPESWTEGLSMFRTLYEKNAFPDNLDDVTEAICIEMFNNKEAAMMLNGSWTTGMLSDTDNVRVVPVPSLDSNVRKPTDIVGGFSMGFYITKRAWDSKDKREAAVQFVEYMTDEEALSRFNSGGAASPGPIKEQKDTSPLILSGRAYVDSATAFVPAVQDSFSKDAREYLFSEIIHIARGKADIEDVLRHFIDLNTK